MAYYDYDYVFKIVLVGESGVGKTSLVQRYIDNQFKHDQMSTIGIDFAIKTIKVRGKYVKLQIWDTAGQERFKVVSRQFYRGSSAFVFVYAMNKPETLSALSEWIKEVHTVSDGCEKFFLVGNKHDIASDEKAGKDFADGNGMGFTMTSAKSGFQVESFIDNLAHELVESLDGYKGTVNAEVATPNPTFPSKKKIKVKKEFRCCSLM